MKLNIGLIGCGIVTIKAHLPALLNNPTDSLNNYGFKISAVCSTNKNRLDYFTYKLPNIESFRDYKKLIDSNICDSVLIATNAKNHLEIAQYALDSNLFVFLEKPVSLTSQAIENFIKKNNENINRIQVGFNKRYYPGFLKFRELINNGIISNIIGGTLFFMVQRSQKYGIEGVLGNMIHLCDLVCWIFNSPVDVKAHFLKSSDYKSENQTISSSILTSSGAVVSLFFSTFSNWNLPYHESIEILDDAGNKFSIRNANEAMFSTPKYNYIYNQSNSIFWNTDIFGYKTQISAFADLVNGKIKIPSSNMMDALEAHKLFEKIYES